MSKLKFKEGDWVTNCYTDKVGKITQVGTNTDMFEYFVGEYIDGSWESEQDLSLGKPLKIHYINWKGKQSWREVYPLSTVFKASEYHNNVEPTWLMVAWDLEKGAEREFQMCDILEIKQIN